MLCPIDQKIAFIDAGSTVFMKGIAGDVLLQPALTNAHIALMDIDTTRLEESELVVNKLIRTLNTTAVAATHTDQKAALVEADFVVVAFQIGGYDPCTISDFDIPKKFGLRQTIGDALGFSGVMRGIRTVSHLWKICDDMLAVCPAAIMLQYVNPMAINTWAIGARYPAIKQVGLCHPVQGTAMELADDLGVEYSSLRYRAAGINHMAFYLNFEQVLENGEIQDLYPALHEAYAADRVPTPNEDNPRCPNQVRYEMMKRLDYFVTESSEHFAEYVPWFIKRDRPDLLNEFGIPLD